MWEEEYNRAQEESHGKLPEVLIPLELYYILVVFHGSAHSLRRHPENQEEDVLTQVQAICSQVPLEAAHCVCVKSGRKGRQQE